MNIVDVYAVYGDYGNVGDGTLIGIFDNIQQAERVSQGRGSLDCGGDGQVVERRAIQDGKDFYLLELNFPISINTDINPNVRCSDVSYSIVITEINNVIEFMKLFRRKTAMSLRETKKIMDEFRQCGKVQLPASPLSVSGTYDKDDAISWKQEAELNNIAKVELVEMSFN